MVNVNDAVADNIVILYEDDDVVVIDKPTGLLVHLDGRTDAVTPTVAAWHAARVPGAASAGEPIVLRDGATLSKPGVVHRLDRDTSGVLILAKHQDAFVHLKAQFKDRHAEKEYRSFVHGQVKEERGIIDRPIGRSAKDFRLRSAQRGARGTLRPATTAWTRIVASPTHSYLALFPKTGRTHQIRTHLKAINHPVVCDQLYAPKQGCALGFARLALHAHRLTITLPNGVRETFTAPLPLDFIEAEQKLM